MTIDDQIEARFETISDTPVLHAAGSGGVRIGRIVRMKMDGKLFDVRFWYSWSDDCPLHHVDSVPVE